MNQKYFDICNTTVRDVMGDTDQGDVTTANNTLSKLLVENTDLKMFLLSTGKYKEYEAWIKRFKTKYNGIENFIKLRKSEHAQIEIHEIAQKMLELVKQTGKFEHTLRAWGY